MDPRFDGAVPYTAPVGLADFEPEGDDPDAVGGREGGWSRTVMVGYCAVIVATAVVLAVADVLA
ncbi:hypothetical protein [Streptomyces sp. ALI-76-A]|jgi:hypothetical protein|uniref:hypothetical protein n=1 Tax=Streptomyces sp. ALI-76-A TaxID=3025736 RepID=UPI00256F4E97|nr:hypothetical protein [Streptomyces sp. ALI-76-A]MDL5205782.1 hypothetical protein [Streptomyces sp. ALI-76-A]